jgi:hypothetical protein
MATDVSQQRPEEAGHAGTADGTRAVPDRLYRFSDRVRGTPQFDWSGDAGDPEGIFWAIRTPTCFFRLRSDGHFEFWTDQWPDAKEGTYILSGEEVHFTISDGSQEVGHLSADRGQLEVNSLFYDAVAPVENPVWA